MMALDGKTIKEEVPEKDSYDTCNSRKTKGKDRCNTPDSPEGARIVAPRSPAATSPHHIHPNIVPTPNRCSSVNRRGSTSPSGSPPPTTTPTATLLAGSITDSQKIPKIRKFLGALVQFGQDTSSEVGDRLRSLVLSLASGGLTIEEFQIAVQDAANFPLRPNAVSFLRSHLPLLQREISSIARLNKQSPNQYVRTNENSAFEMHHNLTDAHADIFLSSESGIGMKRRAPEALLYESHLAGSNLSHEWSDYISPAKRPHHSLTMLSSSALPHLINHPSLFEYQNGIHSHQEQIHNTSSREEREIRSESNRSSRISVTNPTATASQVNGSGISSGDEEWKNIHTMLSCISGMVEKTKKAISILQHRGNESTTGQISHHEVSIIGDIRRQTEEKISEFRRNAEDAVNQVKRQAVLEIQRSVAAAETRAIEAITQERLKMEKIFGDINSRGNEGDTTDTQTPGSNSCWNCGRKANETCGGCSIARYCGAFCQHKDWEQHHQTCGTIASRSTEHSANVKTSVAISQHTRSNTNSSNSSSSRSSPTNQTSSCATTNGNLSVK